MGFVSGLLTNEFCKELFVELIESEPQFNDLAPLNDRDINSRFAGGGTLAAASAQLGRWAQKQLLQYSPLTGELCLCSQSPDSRQWSSRSSSV